MIKTASKKTASKVKNPWIRRFAGVGISLAGFLGILLVKVFFDGFMKKCVTADGLMPIENDNFYIYFKLSLTVCAVLLALTLLSAVTYVLQRGPKSKFSYLTVTLSPAICQLAMIMLAAFYSYLTYDSQRPIAAYLVLLGICEAALYFMPLTIAAEVKSAENRKTERKNSKKGK